MPFREWTIEQLREAYKELELRVTRFSSIEQKLINTQDLLDQELVVYKRINTFNTAALSTSSIEELIQLTAEAIVDIFECEASIIQLKNNIDIIYFEEGISIDKSSSDLDLLFSKQRDKSKIYQRNSEKIFDSVSLGIDSTMFSRNISISGTEISCAAIITSKRKKTFKEFNSRSLVHFDLFIDQVFAQLTNSFSKEEIQRNIKIISESEIELRKLSSIATKTNNGAIITDYKGRIEWANEAFTRITGYSLAEIKGKKPKDFLQRAGLNPPEILEELSNDLKSKKPTNIVLKNVNKNGDVYINELQITPVFDSKSVHVGFIALQRDITEEFLFRERIETINRRFELVNREAKIGIWEFDVNSSQVTWNDVLYDMYEISPDERHDLYSIWVDSIVSENKSDMISLIHNLINDESGYREDEFEIQVNGKTKFIKSSAFVERSDSGTKLLGTNIDITSIKESASKILKQNKDLEKTNLELDQFVYSISHDLRAPLLSIKGILSLFDNKATADSKQLYLSMIEESINRLDETILDILNFSKNSRLELSYEPIDIRGEIQKIIADLDHINKATVELRYFEEENLKFKSDLFRIKIILKNLISNAIKYSKESKLITLEVNVFLKGENFILEIVDNGIGISDADLGKIFNMFFRATSKSVGTGLGLYITKEMVQKLGGEISVQSKLNHGTTFIVILPKK